MSRFSQDFWKHGIDETQSETGARISFTFRHVAPHFRNFTAIVGDSNTKNLIFGTGKGTFGRFMPGKKVKALTIDAIPEPQAIGPVPNIVIHTGINDVNSNNRRPNRILVSNLERKCQAIHAVYPKTHIFVSLLLPTKVDYLNRRVREFNDLLLEMTYRSNNKVKIIDSYGLLTNSNGCLDEKFGRFLKETHEPNRSDVLHVGRKGLSILSTSIKKCVCAKNDNQSRTRFSASRGNYSAAVIRNTQGAPSAAETTDRILGESEHTTY